MLSKTVISLIGCAVAITSHAQTVTVTGNIPYAKKLIKQDGTLDVWTMSKIREDKVFTVNPIEGSVMIKDNNSRACQLGDTSETPNETKTYNGTLDLSNAVLPATIAILVDDIATLTIKEIGRAEGVTGPEFSATPYEVKGTALWNPKSYKEFPIPLPPGRKYQLDLTYTNKANLTSKYTEGNIDVDGVSVYVSLLPVEIMPDDDQPGNTGDLIPSSKGNIGEKHYVSPKKTAEIPDDYVVIKATGLAQDRFLELLEWEGGEAHKTDPMKRLVKRDAAAKHVLRIKMKQGGTEAARMNVWVVWSDIAADNQGDQGKASFTQESGKTGGWSRYWIPNDTTRIRRMKCKITPITIITDTDRPNLSGEKIKDPPGSAIPFPTEPKAKGDHAFHKWDMSRKMEISIANLAGIKKDDLGKIYSDPFTKDQVVVGIHTPVPFPGGEAEGNDDASSHGLDEDTDPYRETKEPGYEHGVGELIAFDAPMFSAENSWGVDGKEFGIRANFRDFGRVELYSGNRNEGRFWFRISDYHDWHFMYWARFSKSTGLWNNIGSSTGDGHK